MSREIDTSDLNALSDDDIVYALQYNKLSEKQQRDLGLSADDVNRVLHGQDLRYTYEQPEEEPTPVIDPEGLVRAVQEEDQYDKMSGDDLRVELLDRELDTSGRKSDMIARLREDDAARSEAESQVAD